MGIPETKKKSRAFQWSLTLLVLLTGQFILPKAQAFTVNVINQDGTPVNGFQWLVEEDNTNVTVPGALVSDSIGLDIHNSYAPPVAKGHSATDSADTGLAADTRYFVSILPDSGLAMGGTVVPVGETAVTVRVNDLPLPTAQISVSCFVDNNPINNMLDEHDQPLGDCSIQVSDMGGQVTQDAFGNPLGTIYVYAPNGQPVLDGNGDPIVQVMGDGNIVTLTQNDFDLGNNPYGLTVGEALIKNLPPGKYGLVAIPPHLDDTGTPVTWIQNNTIEGTPTIDAWVKANEPKVFVEGFGAGFNHADFAFVKVSPATPSPIQGQSIEVLPWNSASPGGTGSIEGTLRYNHFSRPPATQGFFPGPLVPECWIGLNDPNVQPGVTPAGLYAAPCDGNSHFVINNVPAGTYQLVWWDKPLDALFGFATVTVGDGENVNLGDVLAFRWFGTLESNVFQDIDGDGFRDPGEPGIPEQTVNIRFRDGTIYQSFPTDTEGYVPFQEVFPFFKWLVVEVDFARFKATGMTVAVDYGGEIPPANGWITPSFDVLNPQPQAAANPNTGNNLSRTEQGPVLTQAMHLFLNQTNYIDWGKQAYVPGENGGISGIVFYATTRAENDPRFAAGEPWEPGIPRVQVNLYTDADNDSIIDDLDGSGDVTLADVDNYPFGNFPGPEDIDRNYPGQTPGNFDNGDAIQITTTDSWDDNKPSGCVQDLPVIHGTTINECADAFGTWNQVRPGVFDGGYAFDGLTAGFYIVEAVAPPFYEQVKEEDKNVDFGETYTPSPLLVPATCVGDNHPVPPELTLFPGIAAPYAGQMRPLCDRKKVVLNDTTNAAADFFMFTEVPKASRAVGFVNNDLGAEFNQASPNFGEKIAPSWLPVSFRDWTGYEITRVYTDEFGAYNAMLPSTYTVNVASPSGVSPNMLTLTLNDPTLPDGSTDPFYDPTFAVTPWTFQYIPGSTTYLDTPIVPLAAFSTATINLDTDAPNASPVINQVNGPEPEGGPLVCTDRPLSPRQITITSQGLTVIRNPAYAPGNGEPLTITRNNGFGGTEGTVTLDGTPLTIDSWTDASIMATIPGGLGTGRLELTRGDNNLTTEIGLTLHIIDCAATGVVSVKLDGSGQFTSIQAAIDDPTTQAGMLIMVGPGVYSENVIMFKPVQIQGTGTGSTIIDANPTPLERLQLWHDRVDQMGARQFASYLLKDPFVASEAPSFFVLGETIYPNGNLQAELPGTQTLNIGNPFDTPGQALIDGFTMSGSKAGGGVFALVSSHFLVISNNNITGNQGNYAGGIVVGTPDVGFNSANTNIAIRYNKIHGNGGTQGAGGIQMNESSDGYVVENNIILGNFGRFNGGGITHDGLSLGENIIRHNQIIFNENFFGALLAAAGEGGGIYVGGDVAGGTGAGNVTIEANLIQGNLAGAGHGGGIRAFATNGQDVAASPDTPANWYHLRILNNMIVNNVAGHAGGGISLQDVARATIEHNTIANNDSTATSANAFTAGALNSNPQVAGVAAGVHTAILQGLFGAGVAQTYSNPAMGNNIIWHNRSWYNDASLNAGAGGLAVNPAGQYWDIGVEGSTGPGDAHLAPGNSILTSLVDPVTGFNYAGTNLASDPAFVTEYFNVLETATVLDEGGNAISVRFQPLTASSGNYHITGGSPAINLGAATTLTDDFDGEARVGAPDSGADEFNAGTAISWTLSVVSAGSGTGTVSSSPAGIMCGGDCSAQFPSGTLVTLTAVADAGSGFTGWSGGGCSGTGVCNITLNANTVVVATFMPTFLGVFNGGTWTLDSNGNGVLDAGADTTFVFGIQPGDLPVTGDWNGDRTTEAGIYRNGAWFLDLNNNGVWDGPATDARFTLGLAGDLPVSGDWDGDGTTEIGVFRNGTWYLDLNGNGVWDGPATDARFTLGMAGDLPVTGDWDGNGTTEIGVFRNGTWYLDLNGNGVWDGPATDARFTFGLAGDLPVTGDWNRDGTVEIGIFRSGAWYLDLNGNGVWDGPATDARFTFGQAGDTPVTGGW